MEIFRIGDKLVSKHKINSMIDKILTLRVEGFSQQEAAKRLEIDRTFISRLEGIGEVRKGSRIAVVGFPIKNKQEITRMLEQLGVDYQLLMTEEERQIFINDKDGPTLLAEFMHLVTIVRDYDVVVFLGSNYRIKISEAMLDREVVGVVIGESPITEDVYVDAQELKQLIQSLIIPKTQEAKNQ